MNQTPPMAEVQCSSSLRDNPFVVNGLPTQNQVGSQARQSSTAHPLKGASFIARRDNTFPVSENRLRYGALMNRATAAGSTSVGFTPISIGVVLGSKAVPRKSAGRVQ